MGQNFESNFWPLLSGSAADSVSCHVVQPSDGVCTRALKGNRWRKKWFPRLGYDWGTCILFIILKNSLPKTERDSLD